MQAITTKLRTVEELVVLLRTKCNISVSPHTTLKRRKLLDWSSRGAHYCQLIRDMNKEKRLAWAREHLNDPFLDVVWTDETTVQLSRVTVSPTHFTCLYRYRISNGLVNTPTLRRGSIRRHQGLDISTLH